VRGGAGALAAGGPDVAAGRRVLLARGLELPLQVRDAVVAAARRPSAASTRRSARSSSSAASAASRSRSAASRSACSSSARRRSGPAGVLGSARPSPAARRRGAGAGQRDRAGEVDGGVAEPGVVERPRQAAARDGGRGLRVRERGAQRLLDLALDRVAHRVAELPGERPGLPRDGGDDLVALAAEVLELVGVELGLRLAQRGADGEELVELAGLVARQLVQQPGGGRRLAEPADRLRQVLVAGRLRRFRALRCGPR
jgi:hypothetical protein